MKIRGVQCKVAGIVKDELMCRCGVVQYSTYHHLLEQC